MRVTTKRIAEELGLSMATVDRVLNNRQGVSAKTVEKVKAKAQELGYRSNKAAKFLATQKITNVAFILPKFPDYFWNDLNHEITEGAKLYEDFGLRVDVHRVDTVPVNHQVEYMKELVLAKKYEAIVIAAHDTKLLEPIINQAIKQNIAVFTINTDVPHSERIAYVGSDYYDFGYLAGELIHLFTKKASNVILIRETENTFQMINKEKGFKDYFNKMDKKVRIVDIKYDTTAYIEEEQLEELLDRYIYTIMQADAIYIAGGLLDKIIQIVDKWEKRPILIGHDINEEIYQAFQRDLITASICQDPVAQATFTIKKIYTYLLEENIPPVSSHIVKPEIVMKSNAKYYLKNKK
ncbi:LacI family DNA-binding transcriptional regulator [Gracilibacillus alcaliphilus]|uniref:LacI family DNA-binding transcriptional regulator n=1 Tax=Gracilibacillus alcaliphilus TaxID=1401441 RepID=UPI00195E2E12|nr:LacI family DNA-binding transcriptional regulator [Gracilibacillus alcaliphilus]MBM7676181.1 LacI family transcriptional regulator [Gracilibacillus alcaliphilus]